MLGKRNKNSTCIIVLHVTNILCSYTITISNCIWRSLKWLSWNKVWHRSNKLQEHTALNYSLQTHGDAMPLHTAPVVPTVRQRWSLSECMHGDWLSHHIEKITKHQQPVAEWNAMYFPISLLPTSHFLVPDSLACRASTVLRMRIHVHFEFGGTFVCAADRRSLGACVEAGAKGKHSVDKKQIGASRENGHWWRGKHYASVGKKDIWREDGWSR